MTQSNLEELNQTIVDLQSQLDAAKVLLRKVCSRPSLALENDTHELLLIDRDVMATIRAVVAEG